MATWRPRLVGGTETPELPKVRWTRSDFRTRSHARAEKVTAPHVAILLCTYNGGKHLTEQLQSLWRQTHTNWSLIVSDDGSTDETVEILRGFAEKGEFGVDLRHGPRALGREEAGDARQFATANFLSLATDIEIKSDHFAYCDQDDVWAPDKLARAVKWLSTVPDHLPALYCSRTQLVDEDRRLRGFSPLFAKPPAFCNALVQSIAGGNTMVFNRAARDLLAKGGINRVAAHDWWTYMLVTGGGGLVRYDPLPSIEYRQHRQNVVGANQDAVATIRRLRMVLDGGWAQWMDWNLKALQCSAHLLTPENRRVLEELLSLRSGSLKARIATITRLGLYRQTLRGQLALGLAALGGRL